MLLLEKEYNDGTDGGNRTRTTEVEGLMVGLAGLEPKHAVGGAF